MASHKENTNISIDEVMRVLGNLKNLRKSSFIYEYMYAILSITRSDILSRTPEDRDLLDQSLLDILEHLNSIGYPVNLKIMDNVEENIRHEIIADEYNKHLPRFIVDMCNKCENMMTAKINKLSENQKIHTI